MRRRIIIPDDKLIKVMKTNTLDEAANYFKCCRKVIQNRLRSLNKSYYELKHGDKPPFTQEQWEIFTGNMLGDGNIEKREKYFRFCQKDKRYIRHLQKKFSPYSSDVYPSDTIWAFHTIVTPFFKLERSRWYNDNGRKIVPNDLKLTPRIIAYWHMDDGTNCQINRQIRLYTMSFTSEEVEKLIAKLSLFGIKSTMNLICQRWPIILVSCLSYLDFIDMVTPFIVQSMRRKIDTSEVPEKIHEYRSYKLDHDMVNDIRIKYATGSYTQKYLAATYGVHQGSISKIVRNESYPL